jgi:3-hydroxyisobutyrate dehydrogenase-like beta-hydroxyacid dehydrogenase
MGGIMDVGFIGLGNMGAEMARNLLKAGHRVTVYNRTRAKAQDLAATGAQMAERVADACRGETLITMLADDAAVEAVLFGDGGAEKSLPAWGDPSLHEHDQHRAVGAS